jgi:hypothetical protein
MVVGGWLDERAHGGVDAAEPLSILGTSQSKFMLTTKSTTDHHTHLLRLLDGQ